MRNDRSIWGIILVLAMLALPFLLPQNAAAYQINQPQTLGQTNPQTGMTPVCPGPGFTSRIILCVRDTIIYTTTNVLGVVSNYVSKAIAGAITLAVVLWGIKIIASGRPTTVTRDGMILGLKIGAILLFTSNFGGLFPVLLDALEGLLNIIARPAMGMVSMKGCVTFPHAASEVAIMSIWDVIDCYLDKLIGGIYSPITLSLGIVGFLVGLLLTSSIGLFIAMMGFYAIATILFAIARTLYIFVTAYIAFSLMVIISPLFIPMILFQYTKGYFEKWLKLTIGFLLQPIFLLGFLVMFLIAFDSSIYSGKYSLYHTIAGDAASSADFKLGRWLNEKGAYTEKSLGEQAMNIEAGKACTEAASGGAQKCDAPTAEDTAIEDVQGRVKTKESDWETGKGVLSALGIDKLGSSFFKTDIPVRAIDMKKLAAAAGKDENDYKMALFLALIMVVVTMYIFHTMIDHIPFIGSGVVGEGIGMPTFGAKNLAPPGMRGKT